MKTAAAFVVCVAVCLAFALAYAEQPTRPAYEYRVQDVRQRLHDEDTARVLTDELNAAGANGWQFEQFAGSMLVFKRAKR